MKKITLSLLTVICAVGAAWSQPSVTLTAPPFDGSNSTASGPNGTTGHTFHRSAWLVHKSELTSFGGSTNSVVTAMGFEFFNGTGAAASGNFTIYLQNTIDGTYNKGGTWATITPGMFQHFTGTFNLPVTPNTTVVMLPLTTPFTYGGDGVYVALEWEGTVFTSTAQPARYLCNSTGPGQLSTVGGVRNFGLTAPATLTNSNFRPVLKWETGNTLTNELDVLEIWAPGKVASLAGTTHNIQARVMNRSGVPLANVVVSLTATGANPTSATQTITSINAGATQTLNFSYSPANAGLTTMTVSSATDQNNTNNTKVWSQSVTCTEWAYNPPVSAASFTSGDYGFNAGGGIIVSKFEPGSNMSIQDIKLALGTNTNNPGKNLYGALLNSSGAIIATTNTFAVQTGMPGTFITFNFATAQAVTAGQTYYLGVAVPSPPMFPFASLVPPANSPALSGYYYTALGGGVLNPVPGRHFGIEAVIASTLTPIVLTASPTSLCKGETATLTASGHTNATYAWSTGTVTTNTIVVTPSLPGTQTQVAVNYNVQGTDLGSQCPLPGAAISVTVKATPNLTLSLGSKSICIGGKTTLNPSGAATYTIDGGSFNNQSGTSFSLAGFAVGVTSYTVAGTNALGCSSSAVTSFSVNQCVGLEDLAGASTIRIYPNPSVNGIAKVTGLQGSNVLTVFNTLGQAVLTQSANDSTVEFDLSKQAAGNYLVKVQGDSGVQTFRLINQ